MPGCAGKEQGDRISFLQLSHEPRPTECDFVAIMKHRKKFENALRQSQFSTI